MDTMKVGRKLWEHPDPKSTSLYKFMQSSNEKYNLKIDVTFLELRMAETILTSPTELLGFVPMVNHQKIRLLVSCPFHIKSDV